MASTKSSTGQRGWSKENAWGVTGNDICIYFYFILIAIGTLISLEQIIQGHIGSCKDCGSYSKWDGKPWVGEIQIMISHFLKDCTDFLLRIRTTMRYHFTPVRMAAGRGMTSDLCSWCYGQRQHSQGASPNSTLQTSSTVWEASEFRLLSGTSGSNFWV